MKGLILGVAGLGAVGTATYVGTGKPPIDDYVGIINKSPAEVYAALAQAGPDGTIEVPVPSQPGAPKMSRRITKEPGKSMRLEVLMDDRTFASVEFELTAAEGDKTQIAGEVDLDMGVINDAIRARGGEGLPGLGAGLAEGLIDRAFATAMEQAVTRINEGKVSLAALTQGSSGFTNADWSRGGAPDFGGGSGSMSARPTWTHGTSARPAISARRGSSTEAAVDPNQSVQDHLRRQQQVQGAGW